MRSSRVSQQAQGGKPLIVTALFGDRDFFFFERLRREHFPPERNLVPAHLTLFHHLPPSIASELHRRLTQLTREEPAPRAQVAGVFSLGAGVAFRVESERLVSLRRDLADAFEGLLTPQDEAGWRPHVTIQNKVEPMRAKALLKQLESDFVPRQLAIAGLASWFYQGGPWMPIARYPFG